MKTPLSWLQLRHETARLLIAIAGICFADMLMFLQLGLQSALFDSSVTFYRGLDGEIFLFNPQSDALGFTEPFSSRRLYQSAAVDGVESVVPVYLGHAAWKNPVGRNTRTILVIGFNPAQNPANFPGIRENIDQMKLPDTILFDGQSRSEFGEIPELMAQGKKVRAEVFNRELTVGGIFEMGISFAADGNIITSDTNFLRIFTIRRKGAIDIGIINLEPGADIEETKEALRAELPNDVEVLNREEFIEREMDYWRNATALGFIFTMGTAIGFVVGIVIVYQILYTDISNHLREYATLKAIGYKDSYFIMLVFQEAVILAVLGYIPGFVIATSLYALTVSATSLPLAMTFSRASTVFILTLAMCCGSGSLAVKKVNEADPADIF